MYPSVTYVKILFYFQDISEYKCESGKSPQYVPHKPITTVVGASFSVVSIMVANILRLFKVSLLYRKISWFHYVLLRMLHNTLLISSLLIHEIPFFKLK